MRLMTIVFALSACLIFSGCSKKEEKASPQSSAPPAVEKPAVVEKTEQMVKKVEEKAAQVTEQAKEKVAQVTKQGQKKVEQMKTQAQGLITSAQSVLPSGTGQTVYSKSCSSCHKMGIIGAPKTGDKTAWVPLISGGMETLVKAAIHGKGNMPARGGNSSLTDDEVKAAVEYMVEKSQ